MSLEAETRRAAAYQALGLLRGMLAAKVLPNKSGDDWLQHAARIVELADKEQE